jgi:hypothetical protein
MERQNEKQSGKKGKWIIIILLLAVVVTKVVAPVVAGEAVEGNNEELVSQKIQALTPTSKQMVDQATAVLSKGWSNMSQAEQEAFLTLYDPGNTGEVDEQFVQTVLGNYQKIRAELDNEFVIKYEADHEWCQGKQLYFTKVISLHVCPYFLEEMNETRKARTLIHEVAHIALKVNDRPYYRVTSKAYSELTPNGNWTSQLPLVGSVIREIVASDTLYHPDAYAHFALAMSGQPGAMENYLSNGTGGQVTMTFDEATIEAWDSVQVSDGWMQ